MWFAAFSVVGLLVAFAALAWWAKRQGVDIQASLDKVTALQTDAVIKEKSNEAADVAESRSDPALHDNGAIVSGAAIPNIFRRD